MNAIIFKASFSMVIDVTLTMTSLENDSTDTNGRLIFPAGSPRLNFSTGFPPRVRLRRTFQFTRGLVNGLVSRRMELTSTIEFQTEPHRWPSLKMEIHQSQEGALLCSDGQCILSRLPQSKLTGNRQDDQETAQQRCGQLINWPAVQSRDVEAQSTFRRQWQLYGRQGVARRWVQEAEVILTRRPYCQWGSILCGRKIERQLLNSYLPAEEPVNWWLHSTDHCWEVVFRAIAPILGPIDAVEAEEADGSIPVVGGSNHDVVRRWNLQPWCKPVLY